MNAYKQITTTKHKHRGELTIEQFSENGCVLMLRINGLAVRAVGIADIFDEFADDELANAESLLIKPNYHDAEAKE